MPILEERPAPEDTTEATTTNTNEVTTAKSVVRLTLELSPTDAAELAELMASHVSFRDFPWAEAIYNALHPVGSYHAVVFADTDYGANVFLRRKKD